MTATETSTAPTDHKRGRVHHRTFFQQFILRPGSIGAVAPSSPALARRMLRDVDVSKPGVYLEFGPGTGPFTGEILRRLGASSRFAAIELNPDLAAILRRRFPSVRIITDSAANVERICRDEGFGEGECVDAVISGLPWASFPESLQDSILSPMKRVLKPGGKFVTFGYHIGTILPAGKRFYRKATSMFGTVERSELVWRNLPPAIVFTCTK